jgi:hypothetical protein
MASIIDAYKKDKEKAAGSAQPYVFAQNANDGDPGPSTPKAKTMDPRNFKPNESRQGEYVGSAGTTAPVMQASRSQPQRQDLRPGVALEDMLKLVFLHHQLGDKKNSVLGLANTMADSCPEGSVKRNDKKDVISIIFDSKTAFDEFKAELDKLYVLPTNSRAKSSSCVVL